VVTSIPSKRPPRASTSSTTTARVARLTGWSLGRRAAAMARKLSAQGPVYLGVQVIQVGKRSAFALHRRLVGCLCPAGSQNQGWHKPRSQQKKRALACGHRRTSRFKVAQLYPRQGLRSN